MRYLQAYPREGTLRLASLVVLVLLHAATASPEDVLRIYVARHGQTDWNVARRLQGGTDVPLNETGRRQAAELADRLAGVRLDRIYSSALQRSRQTAEALHGRAPIEPLPGLNEQSLGAFEGLYLDGRDLQREAEYERRSLDPEDCLDGGESATQHFARVQAAVQAIRSRHAAGDLLIVGHGGTNAMVLRALLGLTAEQASAIEQANDELYMVELRTSQPPAVWKRIPADRLKDL
jgi:2,3-bisphosphoglycerate-dependent phosphoglycerate mutase